MKKILLIILLFSLQGYSQKTLEVYNFTNQTVRIRDLITNASGSSPEFHSKPSGLITIGSNASYTLVNTADEYKFPFDSPTSSPYITTWQLMNPPALFNIASGPAWALSISAGQVFAKMSFDVGAFGYSIDVTNTLSSPVTGPGFTAEYSIYTAPPPSNIVIYTIMIY